MSEALAEAAMRFQKARFYLHCWALTPEETQVLQEMLEKKGNETMDEELFTEEAINRLTIPEGGFAQELRVLRVPGRGHRDLHQPRPEVADGNHRG